MRPIPKGRETSTIWERGGVHEERTMAHSTTIGVYIHSYSVKNPTPAQQQALLAGAELLGYSNFNLIMLASMHVHEDGTIYYGDTPMISGGQPSGQLAPNLAACISKMKGSASDGTVLASFGGGGSFNGEAVGWYDFTHIQALIDQYPNPADNPFFQNLACMFSTYPIDGFDIDLESYQGYDSFTPTLITIIEWLRTNGRIATLCPYDAADFWCNVVSRHKAAARRQSPGSICRTHPAHSRNSSRSSTGSGLALVASSAACRSIR
jgi:hypothetical protein